MKIPAKEKPLYITGKEICEATGISQSTLWRMEHDQDRFPDFPAPYGIVRSKRWDRVAMLEFLEKHHVNFRYKMQA